MLLLNPVYPILNNYAYGSFTNSGPLTALGSSLKAWMNADDHGTARMTDDGAGLISQWKSNDGANLVVTAATTARPTWTSNAISSPTGKFYAGLTFDGTANCFVSTTLTNIPTGSTAGEIWAFCDQTKTAAGISEVVTYGGSGVDIRQIGRNNTSKLLISDGGTLLIDTIWAFQGKRLVRGTWSGTTEAAFNNTKETSPRIATIASLNTGTTRLRIGADIAVTAGSFFQGVIRHIFITTALTSLQVAQLEGWIAWDSGWRILLPSSHPFRNRRP